MADADGATKFSDIDKVEAALRDLNPKPVRLCWVYRYFFYSSCSVEIDYCSSTVHRQHQEHFHSVFNKTEDKLEQNFYHDFTNEKQFVWDQV